MDTNELPIPGRGGFLPAGYVYARPEIGLSGSQNLGGNRHALQRLHNLFAFRWTLPETAGTGWLSFLIKRGRESHNIRWFRQLLNRREIQIRQRFNSQFTKHYDSVSVSVGSDGEFAKRLFPDT